MDEQQPRKRTLTGLIAAAWNAPTRIQHFLKQPAPFDGNALALIFTGAAIIGIYTALVSEIFAG